MKALAVHMLQFINISQRQDGDIEVWPKHCEDRVPVLDRENIVSIMMGSPRNKIWRSLTFSHPSLVMFHPLETNRKRFNHLGSYFHFLPMMGAPCRIVYFVQFLALVMSTGHTIRSASKMSGGTGPRSANSPAIFSN